MKYYDLMSNFHEKIMTHLFNDALVEFKMPYSGLANSPNVPVTDPSIKPFKPEDRRPASGSNSIPKRPINYRIKNYV